MLRKSLLIIITNRNICISIKDNTKPGNFRYLFQIDNIRTMYPHKIRWKPFLHFLKAGKGYDRFILSFYKDTHVFAHPFNIPDIFHINAHHFVVSLFTNKESPLICELFPSSPCCSNIRYSYCFRALSAAFSKS